VIDERHIALTAALVEVEEDKIDPRWFYDGEGLPEDYEPPGIGCEDAAALLVALTNRGWDLVKKP